MLMSFGSNLQSFQASLTQYHSYPLVKQVNRQPSMVSKRLTSQESPSFRGT